VEYVHVTAQDSVATQDAIATEAVAFLLGKAMGLGCVGNGRSCAVGLVGVVLIGFTRHSYHGMRMENGILYDHQCSGWVFRKRAT
jgi:hypothetical protein